MVGADDRRWIAWAHSLDQHAAQGHADRSVTRLDDAGRSARAIADHLGHAKPSMTQDVYMGRNVASAQAGDILSKSAS